MEMKNYAILKQYLKEHIRNLLHEDEINNSSTPSQQPAPNQSQQQNTQPQSQNIPKLQLQKGEPGERVGIINHEQAAALIRGSHGRIFTVIFIKRSTGEKRVMNARLGVKAFLHGGELPYNPNDKNLIPCYDIQKRAYRMINIDGIEELKIDKYIFKVQK